MGGMNLQVILASFSRFDDSYTRWCTMDNDETFNFDKFVDDICQRENHERSIREDRTNEQEEHPV